MRECTDFHKDLAGQGKTSLSSRLPCCHIGRMPLHLDPLSRRRFLGGGTVLALSPLLSHSPVKAADSETWALLSDTHIAADPSLKSRQDVNMADNLRRVIAEVVAEKSANMVAAMQACGCTLNNAYMQFSLLALVVIPELRISDIGIIDVRKFEQVPLFV